MQRAQSQAEKIEVSESQWNDSLLESLSRRKINIKPGDVICKCNGYRNENKYIYDGLQLQCLYNKIDDYGSVPPIKTLAIGYKNYFHPHYWEYVVSHNQIIWFDREVLEGLTIEEREMKTMFEDFDDVPGTDYIGYDRKQYWTFIFASNEVRMTSTTQIKDHILSGKCYFVSFEAYVEVWLCNERHFDW
jgi:hypothetical protein